MNHFRFKKKLTEARDC